MQSLIIDNACFACGKANAAGLKLDIRRSDGPTPSGTDRKAVCTLSLSKDFQGYGEVIHGGILSTILDELMIYALYYQEIPTVTAKMEVAFKRKVTPGETLRGEAWMKRNRGRMVEASGALWNSEDQVVATASGLFARVENVVRKENR